MKIGICTIQYAHNYGAMLQAYALKYTLERLGHSVVMIDRRHSPLFTWSPRRIQEMTIKNILLYPKYLYKWYIPVYATKKRRERNFERFLNKYLNDKPYHQEKLDVIVYGSDQIWSKYEYGYDKVWWGLENSNTDKRISYAASMGVLDIEKEDEEFVKNALARFSAISVREKNLKDFLNAHHLFNCDVELMIDPTFLLSKEEWSKINPKRMITEPYLLFYDFQKDEETTRIAHYIAEQKHLRIIRLSNGVEHVSKEEGYLVTAGPFEFISLFKYADFIVSSSFHGTAFAVIYNKPFYVRQVWNKDRVNTLLNTLDLTNRAIDNLSDIKLHDKIDYSKVNQKIIVMKRSGINFLKQNLH